MQNITTSQKDPISGVLPHHGKTMGAIFAALVALCLVFVFQPNTAWAFSSSQVDIQASLNNQGDLSVQEQRTVELTDSQDVLTWTFDNLGEAASVQVTGVTMTHNGQQTALTDQPFNLEWRTSSGPDSLSYSFDNPENTLYVFCADTSNTTVVFEIDYIIKDAAVLYSDYGELFWQFVSPEWAEASQNVSLSLKLPLSDGAKAVAGDTVFAWAHGPSDMSVSIDEAGVISCHAQQVQAKQFAQVRTLFPAEWLSGIQATDKNADVLTQRFDTVLNEEKAWSDWGNTNFTRLLSVLVVLCLLSVVALVWALVSFVRFKNERKSADDEKPNADLLSSKERAAIVGRIDRFNVPSQRDFYATVMDLLSKGALSFNREAESLEVIGNVANALPVGIERSALSLLCKMSVQSSGSGSSKTAPSSFDGQSISLAALKRYKDEKPAAYQRALEDWNKELDQGVAKANCFETYFKAKKTGLSGAVLVLIIASIIGAVIGNHPALLIPGFVSVVIMIVTALCLKRRTAYGASLQRSCDAFRLWLKDHLSMQASGEKSKPDHKNKCDEASDCCDLNKIQRCIIDAFVLDIQNDLGKRFEDDTMAVLASRLSSLML